MLLWQALLGLLALTACLRNWRAVSVAVCLLADWSACTFVPDMNGHWPWLAWGAADLIAGVTIACIANNRAALLIAFTYVFEVVCHVAFGGATLSGHAGFTAQVAYWTCTHWAAWAQAWLLALWIMRDGLVRLGWTADAGGRSGRAAHVFGSTMAAHALAKKRGKEAAWRTMKPAIASGVAFDAWIVEQVRRHLEDVL